MRGVILLREYLLLHGESKTAFAKRAGLDRVWLHRLIAFGKPRNLRVKDARAIQIATGGDVPVDSFVEDCA